MTIHFGGGWKADDNPLRSQGHTMYRMMYQLLKGKLANGRWGVEPFLTFAQTPGFVEYLQRMKIDVGDYLARIEKMND